MSVVMLQPLPQRKLPASPAARETPTALSQPQSEKQPLAGEWPEVCVGGWQVLRPSLRRVLLLGTSARGQAVK